MSNELERPEDAVNDLRAMFSDSEDFVHRFLRLERAVETIAAKWPDIFGEALDLLPLHKDDAKG